MYSGASVGIDIYRKLALKSHIAIAAA